MTHNDHHSSHPILYPISFNTPSPSPTLRDNLWLRNNAYLRVHMDSKTDNQHWISL